MATRSHIGKLLSDGSVKYIYCHWDGYPEHNGKILKEYYTNEAKVDALLELGGLSILGEEIGEQQDFDNRDTHNSKWCLAYGRDRGEDGVEAKIAEDIEDMIFQSYHYVWDSGVWRCFGSDGRELVF
jgi:hypothetical protein